MINIHNMNLIKYSVHLVFFFIGLSPNNLFSQDKKESDVPVRTYEKKDGTTVPKHFRTTPNYTNRDNFSTKGNTNPYNGKKGTINPDNNKLGTNNREFSEYSRSDNNPYDKVIFFRYFPTSSVGFHTNTSGLGIEMTYRKRSNVFGVGYSVDMSSYSYETTLSQPNFVDFWKIIYGRRVYKNYFIKVVSGIQKERNHYYRGSRFVERIENNLYKGVGFFGVFGEGNLSFIPEIIYDEYWGVGFGIGFSLNL
jgi:hypothetical protein